MLVIIYICISYTSPIYVCFYSNYGWMVSYLYLHFLEETHPEEVYAKPQIANESSQPAVHLSDWDGIGSLRMCNEGSERTLKVSKHVIQI